MEKKHNIKNYLWIGGIFIVCLIVFSLMSSFSDFGSSGIQSNSYKSVDSISYNDIESNYRTDYTSKDNFAPDVLERKIVKNANINLKSDNYGDSKNKIQASVKAHNAIILTENEQIYNDEYRNIYYTIKLDSTKVDIFMDEIKTYADVQSFNIYSDDLTGKSLDYSQRLARFNAQITKYEVMLNKNPITISEEIDIQNRIVNLENQIYNLQKNINTIDENVKYSDIKITLSEKESFLSEIDFLGLGDGFKLFLNSLQFGIKFFLSLLGFILPFSLVYGIYRLFKKKHNHF